MWCAAWCTLWVVTLLLWSWYKSQFINSDTQGISKSLFVFKSILWRFWAPAAWLVGLLTVALLRAPSFTPGGKEVPARQYQSSVIWSLWLLHRYAFLFPLQALLLSTTVRCGLKSLMRLRTHVKDPGSLLASPRQASLWTAIQRSPCSLRHHSPVWEVSSLLAITPALPDT